MQLAYALLVNDEVHNFMRRLEVAIYEQYGSNPAIRLPPHITLKQGFSAGSLKPFEDYLDVLARTVEPFEIVTTGIGSFEQGIIFLDVAQDPRLKTLQRRILEDLSSHGAAPAPFEDDRYHFHATVASGLEVDALHALCQTLKDTRADFRFVFETLGLFYHAGAHGWILYKRAAMKRG